jgi:hypothetical protein
MTNDIIMLAGVVELADTQVLGTCAIKSVEVQLLSLALL